MVELHVSLGPVQAFVAQARRTRDFWGGSFLLSWLAGVAMQTVRHAGCKLLFPTGAGPFLGWIAGTPSSEACRPQQGLLPNRFVATVPDDFDPNCVVESIQRAWTALAERVWENDRLATCAADSTREIWERQVKHFWQVQWAMVPAGSEARLALERRKNWRTHHIQEEPGVKCSVMGTLQELSGIASPSKRDAESAFWQAVREQIGDMDLRPREQLSAIAFIKRRFARYFQDLYVPDMPGGWTLRGWKLPESVPSVSYIAAAPWIAEVLKDSSSVSDKTLGRFVETARTDAEISFGEYGSHIACIDAALKARPGAQAARDFANLDGSAFYEETLQEKPAVVLGALRELTDAVGKQPPKFYAVVMMDGDELGKMLRHPGAQQPVSQALDEFTKNVPGIVRNNSGFLIYAGGDDVLALFPTEHALTATARLRAAYRRAFQKTSPPDAERRRATISAAVTFVHVKVPLTRVLTETHDLLDEVAKRRTGRDAIAVRVRLTSGVGLEWAQPWDVALKGSDDDATLVIAEIAEQFRGGRDDAQTDREPEYSSKFFYKIREIFDVLNPAPGSQPAAEGSSEPLAPDDAVAHQQPAPGSKPRSDSPKPLSPDDAVSLLAAEYLSSGVNEALPKEERLTLKEARERVSPLLKQCRPQTRERTNGADHKRPPSNRLEADGALLVRFLATRGRDRR